MKTLILLLFVNISIAQSSIVASGNETYTVGATFPIMQQVDTIVEVSLSVPKYEVEQPTAKPEPVKKKSLFQKIIEFIKNLISNVSH